MSKLFVGNLPHSITETGLADFVTKAGFNIVSAVVVTDKLTGQARGFGFVELAEGQDLHGAIRSLNGQALEGRTLTVNEAHPPRSGSFGSRDGGSGGRRGGRDRFGGRRDY